MKLKLLFTFLLALWCGMLTSNAQVSVTATAGTPSLPYTSLQLAFAAINAGTHQGVITISITASYTETVTALLNASGNGSASYSSITISPSGGAFVVDGSLAGAPLIDLAGADNVKIDGINSGGNALTFSNTSNSNTANTSTIRFMNDATADTISNCTILGSASATLATAAGAILFSTTTGTTGNDNNAIIGCDIGPAGANLPYKAICGLGSSTTPALCNSGILIQDCKIHDFFTGAAANTGIYLGAGSTDWVVNNNKFYQTAARAQTATGAHSAIYLGGSNNNNHQITNNIIGYSSSAGTGSYTISQAGTSPQVMGIYVVTAGTTTANTIQGNTMTAMTITGSGSGTNASAPFFGIYLGSGLMNVTGNTFGSATSTGAISFTSTSATTGEFIGIYVALSNALAHTISNNVMGGITVINASGATNFYGIKTSSANTSNVVIANNIIGGAVANSIQSTSTSTASIVAGMYIATGPACTITGNIIRNLTANGGTSTTLGSVCGIAVVATTAQTVSQNTIYGLTNTNTSAVSVVNGLYLSISGTNAISRNVIHSLNNASSAGTIQGINITTGPIQCLNNMIRLGIDTAGASITNGLVINGINETGTSANNFYHNSIYVGGSGVTGLAISTYAFNSTVATATRNYINNIFMNVRSNGTGTGKHYTVKVGGTVANPAGLTMKNNVFYVNGTGGVFGSFNGADIANLNAWQIAVGGNTGSGFGNPQFVAATGNTATVNLHIDANFNTPVEGMGAVLATGTVDFDSTVRNATTPDIGADEGSFTLMDVYAPILTYTKLFNHDATSLRSESNLLSVADYSGVNTTSGTKPRLYYKKPLHDNAYLGNTSADNGWKYVEATNSTAPFSFDINYTLLLGGAPMGVTDTIQYFIVAQDLAVTPNIGINAGTFSTVPATVDLIAANFPILGTVNMYKIVNSRLSGSITVGAGGGYSYPTLTAAAADLALRGISNSVQISLMDPTYTSATETFPITFSIDGASVTKTVTIQPTQAGTIIAGSNATAILDLNGGHHIMIDGRIGGSGSTKNLIIENTNTAAASTVRLINDAYKNTIQYCTVKGVAVGATSGTVLFSTTTGTIGNDTNTIDNCDIKNGVSRPIQGIYASGSTANTTIYNDNNTISNSNIYNYFHATVASSGIKVDAGNAGWAITNNSFFDTTAITYTSIVTHRAIYINSSSANNANGSGFMVSNNMIGGNGPGLTDTLRITSTGTATTSIYTPIELAVGMGNATQVLNNTISNIKMITSSSGSIAFTGINIERGVTNITGNTIGSTTGYSIDFTTSASGGGMYGIRTGNTTPMGTTNISGNTVCGIELKGSTTAVIAQFQGISVSGGTIANTTTVANNIVGSATFTNAINLSTPSVGTTGQVIRLIHIANGALTTYNVTGNLVANVNTNNATTGSNILYGIYYTPSATSLPATIHNNEVRDLTTASQNAGTGAASTLGGIVVTSAAAGVVTITNNKIYGLELTGAPVSPVTMNARGLYFGGTGAAGNVIANNRIHSMGSSSSTNTSASIIGIEAAGGASSYYNNIVRLGINDMGNDEVVGYQINGIKDSVGTNNYYYNSVYIGGLAVTNGTSNTYAFNSSVVTNLRAFINNSFYNARSNSASTGKHYAVKVGGTAINPAGLTMNNNLMYTSGTGGVFGYYNLLDVADLTAWTIAVGQNTGSLLNNPLYANPTGTAALVDLAPQGGSGLFGAGVPVSGITTDMIGQSRNALAPTIGAGESTLALPVQLLSFNGVKEQAGNRLTWVTASELNNAHFNVQRSLDGSTFETIATVKGKGTTQQLSTYSYVDSKRFAASKVYYRLLQVDFNRNTQTSEVVVIDLNQAIQSTSFTVVPNPFEGMPNVLIQSELSSQATVKVFDLTGQVIVEKPILLVAGQNLVQIDELLSGHQGMYIIQVATPSGVYTQRALKLN